MGPKNLGEKVEVVPNAMTTSHCQIKLRPWGAVIPIPLVDPGQSLGQTCGGEAPEAPGVLHFTVPKNELSFSC